MSSRRQHTKNYYYYNNYYVDTDRAGVDSEPWQGTADSERWRYDSETAES